MFSRRVSGRTNRRNLPSHVLSSGPSYDPTTDTRILARFRADNGLTDMAASSAFGNLIAQNGATAIGTDADGNAVWQFRSATAAWLKTNSATNYPAGRGVVHLFLIAQSRPTPTHTNWFCDNAGGNSFIGYTSAAAAYINGGGSVAMAATTTNMNLYNVYMHTRNVRYSVNGAAYSGITANTGSFASFNQGFLIGSQGSNASTSDVDIAEIILYEGPAPDTFLSWLTGYCRARYPSIGVSATPPAQFTTVGATSLGGLFTAPFDFWLAAGQSNIARHSSAATATPAAGTWELGNDNIVKALATYYDDPTAQSDEVSTDSSVATFVGGLIPDFANTYQAATGRPLMIVPCMVSSSGFASDNIGNPWFRWEPTYPRSNKQRNSLYGSMLARYRNMIALGGTYRGLVWYQGEAACASTTQANLYQARTKALFDALAADTGVDRVVFNQIQDASALVGAALTTVQTAQSALAVAHKRLLNPKTATGGFESDNLHNDHVKSSACGVALANLALAEPAGTGWY